MGPREPSFFRDNLKLGASNLDDDADVTFEQKRTEQELSLEKRICELEKDPLVKLALKALGESDRENKDALGVTPPADGACRIKAEEIVG